MEIKNKDLKRRILEISYKHKLSHLGSNLTAVDIIDEIFQVKKPDEKFVLSSGHAGLALYVVIEKYVGLDAEKIFEHHGVHPDYCNQCHLDCSTGSLGQGLSIAVGMALADRDKNIYCLISDGECAEGSVHEAMRIVNQYGLVNLKIYVNDNGYAAYQETDTYVIPKLAIRVDNILWDEFPFLNGQDAHYHVMNEEEYNLGMGILNG